MNIEIKIKETLGLKDYFIKYYSFSFFGYLRNNKALILKNNQRITFNDIVNVNDLITIKYTPIKQEGTLSNKPLKVVYEDEDCIVVNKPSGIPSIPSALHQEDTLFNRLLYYFKDQEVTLHFINRLDKDTSGLILICKHQLAACLFNKVSDSFIKEYQAETYKPLPNKEDIIELKIKKLEGIKRGVSNDGEYSKTSYKFISEDEGTYRYLIRLYTGLTHQIRVTLSYLGSPIINDPIYGDDLNKSNSKMHLHACYLKFYHPLKDQWIELTSIPNFYS